MKRLISIIVYIVIAVLAVGTIFLMTDHSQRLQAQHNVAAIQEEARRPYLAKRLELTTQIAQLEQQLQKLYPTQMGIHILFAEPDQRILTEALPMMDRYHIVGTIAVSDAFFPGSEGMLTASEMQQLLDKGWDICLSLTSQNDAAALIGRLADAGFAIPTTAYFPDGDCTLADEAHLSSLGVQTIVQYGMETLKEGNAPSLWLIPAYGTFDESSGTAFDKAFNTQSNVVFTEGWQRSRETFTTEDFRDNLELFTDYVNLNHAKISNISTACTQHIEAEAFRQANEAEWQQLHADLVQQLETVEQKLLELNISPIVP